MHPDLLGNKLSGCSPKSKKYVLKPYLPYPKSNKYAEEGKRSTCQKSSKLRKGLKVKAHDPLDVHCTHALCIFLAKVGPHATPLDVKGCKGHRSADDVDNRPRPSSSPEGAPASPRRFLPSKVRKRLHASCDQQHVMSIYIIYYIYRYYIQYHTLQISTWASFFAFRLHFQRIGSG